MPDDPTAAVLADATWKHVDWGPGGSFFDERSWTDPDDVAAGLDLLLGDRTVFTGFTAHLRASMLRASRRLPGDEEVATVQLGVRLLVREGETVRAPLTGEVVRDGSTGPMVLHHRDSAVLGHDEFFTCWYGLDRAAAIGSRVAAGDELGVVAAGEGHAGLGASVHVQVLLDEGLLDPLPPAWVRASEVPRWSAVTADPGPLLGLPSVESERTDLDSAAVVALRDRRLARSQRAYYREPPKLVRGRGVWLYDEHGRGYLDAINNVSHVGHAEPRISAAAVGQLSKLNTNSRFLYEGIATYAERLVATLPAPLEVVFLVCTGSEANDLALRIARQVTGRNDVMGISPNRYKGPGGRGAPPTTHEVVRPDVYRGDVGRDDPDAGHKYALDVRNVAQRLLDEDRPPAAFIAESLMGTAGNIVFPQGYLRESFDAVREVGGLCLSDEVQVGVGRLGTHFWGFEVQGVVPDIVTMGKPLGNGHPIAAVVTTREIADAFDDGVKYFNTFGGNPVSCAIGTTVLDIVAADHLQENALSVGGYFLSTLEKLKHTHPLIGDVRGQGLYLGIELVRDRATLEPAASEALEISEAMKDHGVIVYPTGAYDNVLKIKPPMIFSRADVDVFAETLDWVLSRRAEPTH
jgi:4-aminobutyrate aminotransferase-like enzyme